MNARGFSSSSKKCRDTCIKYLFPRNPYTCNRRGWGVMGVRMKIQVSLRIYNSASSSARVAILFKFLLYAKRYMW